MTSPLSPEGRGAAATPDQSSYPATGRSTPPLSAPPLSAPPSSAPRATAPLSLSSAIDLLILDLTTEFHDDGHLSSNCAQAARLFEQLRPGGAVVVRAGDVVMADDTSSKDASNAGQSSPGKQIVPPLPPGNRSNIAPTRDKDVTDAIQSLLQVKDTKAIIQRAHIRDKETQGYIRDETLVFLIKSFHAQERRAITEALSEVLVCRIQRAMQRSGLRLPPARVSDFVNETISRLFIRILSPDQTSGSFLQVRFGHTLKRIIQDVKDDWLDERLHNKEAISLNGLDDDLAYLTAKASTSISKESKSIWSMRVHHIAEINEGLHAITQTHKKPYRHAFIMREYLEMPVGDRDWAEPCIAVRFDKSRRTIQNWLNVAEAELQVWREG